ncbi:hereditary hemochromatosis protein homolog [Synchiropus splendidus]|uniref:hereditary hemochromatosis protein homolog n=1 Tax=Synchiropus splendidus TaxID=270530 RepID=UPI00237D505B|nr:hereditary hemochromatosis protein homolog [Synchiropus splendidus]
MWTFWIQLMLVSTSVQQVTSSGRHSLWTMATYISGPSQFPKCSLVLMLDDLQVGYIDSTLDNPVISGMDRTPLNLGQNAMRIVHHIYSNMRGRIKYSTKRFNHTKGLHVQQRIAGCEIQDGQPMFIMSRDGYDAQDFDCIMFDTTHLSYTVGDGWESQWNAAELHYVQTLYQHFYLPTCAAVLNQLLDQNKNLLTRQVQPRLTIFSKQVKGRALLTCLATDFYPRHINLTLLQDGRQVQQNQLTAGRVLPNGNGLYQMRITLVLTEQELLQKHNYTCTAAHLSLDNRLLVSWRAGSYYSHRAHLLSPLVLVTVVLLLLLVLVIAKCCKPREPGARRDTVEAESATMVNRNTDTVWPPGGVR